jgi:uncharacterized sulfatase
VNLIIVLFGLALTLVAGGNFAVAAGADGQSALQPPNVLMIVSDDQAYGDYGFMGHPVIRTPHLDKLASESAVFRRGYTPTALCRPSLMSMITGLYPHQHRVTGNDPRQLPGMAPNDLQSFADS